MNADHGNQHRGAELAEAAAGRALDAGGLSPSHGFRISHALFDVLLNVKFAYGARVGHRTHCAVDRPRRPWPVVLATDRPGDIRIAVRVPAVEQIAIVEPNRDVER